MAYQTVNPANNQLIKTYPAHSDADVEAALQQADDLPAENHADRQRQNDRHRRAERQREKHPHAGNVEMLREIFDQMV